MNTLIFGGRGYMGGGFLRLYPNAIASSVDIADCRAVAETLEEHQPDVVINAAGKTGRPNIDWCEDHKEETVRSNITGPLVLQDECKKRGIFWVHLGSGCVYEGDNDGKGFTEDDAPNFSGSFYSRTKARCDEILRECAAPTDGKGGILLLRLRMPFDGSREERNLIMKLAKYRRVLDVQNSLTYLPDFFTAAAKLIQKRKTGVYNVVNPGTLSPYAIMQLYRKMVDPSHTFQRLAPQDLGTVTKAGRSNCVLCTEKLKGEGISLRPVEEAIREAFGLISGLKCFN